MQNVNYQSVIDDEQVLLEVSNGAYAFMNKIKANSVTALWIKLSKFITDSLKAQKGVLLPNLGTFRVGPIVGETSRKKIRPVFSLLEGRYGNVSQEKNRYVVGGNPPIIQPNYSLLASSSGLHRHACQRILFEVLQRLSIYISAGRVLKVSFPGLGILQTNRAGRLEFQFNAFLMEAFEHEREKLMPEMEVADTAEKMYDQNEPDIRHGLKQVYLHDPPLLRPASATSSMRPSTGGSIASSYRPGSAMSLPSTTALSAASGVTLRPRSASSRPRSGSSSRSGSGPLSGATNIPVGSTTRRTTSAERIRRLAHQPYDSADLLDLWKLCSSQDRLRSGCVPRLTMEGWLHKEGRDVLSQIDGATIMELLTVHTYGKTAKHILYKPFLDALEAVLRTSLPPQGRVISGSVVRESAIPHDAFSTFPRGERPGSRSKSRSRSTSPGRGGERRREGGYYGSDEEEEMVRRRRGRDDTEEEEEEEECGGEEEARRRGSYPYHEQPRSDAYDYYNNEYNNDSKKHYYSSNYHQEYPSNHHHQPQEGPKAQREGGKEKVSFFNFNHLNDDEDCRGGEAGVNNKDGSNHRTENEVNGKLRKNANGPLASEGGDGWVGEGGKSDRKGEGNKAAAAAAAAAAATVAAIEEDVANQAVRNYNRNTRSNVVFGDSNANDDDSSTKNNSSNSNRNSSNNSNVASNPLQYGKNSPIRPLSAGRPFTPPLPQSPLNNPGGKRSEELHYHQQQHLQSRSRFDYDEFNRTHFEKLHCSRGKNYKREIAPKVNEEPLNVQAYHCVRQEHIINDDMVAIPPTVVPPPRGFSASSVPAAAAMPPPPSTPPFSLHDEAPIPVRPTQPQKRTSSQEMEWVFNNSANTPQPRIRPSSAVSTSSSLSPAVTVANKQSKNAKAQNRRNVKN